MQVLALLASLPLLIFSGGMQSPAESDSVQRLADTFVERQFAPGIAIGVLHKSGRVSTYCAGTLEFGDGRPITEDTIFEIGSITKVFTATLAHLLEQRGELSLAGPLRVHLPDEVDIKVVDGNEITLWHLATHTSGLPRMPDNPDDSQPNPHLGYTNAQLYKFLEVTGPQRAPGQCEYSNIGMGLLGHVLELNQNASYQELAQQHLLEPLKMSSTSCVPRDADAGRVATAHGGLEPVGAWNLSGPFSGAGDLNSSIKDMMKFAQANVSDSDTQLHRSIRACHIPQVKNSSHGDQGLGWQVNSTPGREVIWHNGQTGGFASYMGIQPDSGTAVVVLCNSNRGVSQAAQIGGHLLFPHVVRAEDIPWMIPTYRPKTPIDFGKYVGRYKSKSGSKFVVENRNGELFARLEKQNFIGLRPIRKDLFQTVSVNAQLRFQPDARGGVKALVLEQNGRKTTYTRVP